MVDYHGLNSVIPKEAHHSGVVSAVVALVMQAMPVCLVNLPLLNFTVLNRRHRDPVGFAPSWVHLALGRHRNRNNHLLHLPSIRSAETTSGTAQSSESQPNFNFELELCPI